MVILNGLKYACETCIKGHRSSACSHTDRTLFEIKKKGRPITQCEHCRNLRKTRQVHVKCLCGTRPSTDKSNGTRAKLKLPTAATIRLDPDDPTHATITAGPALLPPKTKVVKPKSKVPKECCKPAEPKSCNTRPSSPSPSSLPSAPVTPPPSSAAATSSSSSSCCSSSKAKSHSSNNHSSKPNTTVSTSNDDTYTASLLDDLSRSAARTANANANAHTPAVATTAPVIDPYHHHVQPFYNPSLTANSFAWQSGVNLGSCSCGITCACPGCYEHSLSTSMILFSGENCPYSCTTCTACNGFGVTSHVPNAFILPSHPAEHWRQPSSSSIVSAAPFIAPHAPVPVPTPAPAPTPASTSSAPGPGPDKSSNSTSSSSPSSPSAVSRCCGGPCKCIVCNCDKAKDGEEIPERLGFAVSGERGGCCTDTNRRVRYRPPDEPDSSVASSETTTRDCCTKDVPTTFSMQSNPATAQIQMHSIEVPKLVA